jgi:hypothetical protein
MVKQASVLSLKHRRAKSSTKAGEKVRLLEYWQSIKNAVAGSSTAEEAGVQVPAEVRLAFSARQLYHCSRLDAPYLVLVDTHRKRALEAGV